MRLYTARIWCEACGKHFRGDAMSNAEDAEDMARIDHRIENGHFAHGDAAISETDSEAGKRGYEDVPQERRDGESERRSYKPERRPDGGRRGK